MTKQWLKKALSCTSKTSRCSDCKQWMFCIEKYVKVNAERKIDYGLEKSTGYILPC